jgi:serine/threonine protein kinase
VLGHGGFGIVVEYLRDEEHVALKVAPSFDYSNDNRSFREAEIHKSLSNNPITSEFITKYIDSKLGVILGMEYPLRCAILFTELMETDLESLLYRNQTISVHQRKSMMRVLLLGTRAIHTAGFCHFDVCTPNILYSRDAGLKVFI